MNGGLSQFVRVLDSIVTVQPIAPVDVSFYLTATSQDWQDFIDAKYPNEEDDI